MDTLTAISGRRIVIGAILLLILPNAWTVLSLDLSTYSVPAVLFGKGASLGLLGLCALALLHCRWLQLFVGVISAVVGILGVLGCAGSLVLGVRGDIAQFGGRSIFGQIVYTLCAIFVAWAFLFSREVRDYGNRPNQSLQRNAGSRPSSGDSPASETPSSLGPRG